MKVDLLREFTFEAAHRNTSAPNGAFNARLHGHSYRVTVVVSGRVDDRLGWLVDFADVKAACRPVIAKLDHRLLNDIEGMTDTSCADVSRWLSSELKRSLPGFARCDVQIIGSTSLQPAVERDDSGNEPAERIHFGFAAAHFLPEVPPDHKCRRMHGHSFRIQIGTSDSEAVLKGIEAIYPRLDHRLLNEVAGLENPTSEMLAQWIWNALADSRAEIKAVTISETCESGCVYYGKD